MNTHIVKRYARLAVGIILVAFPAFSFADAVGPISFESPTYSIGIINGQDGWTALGSAGSGCAVYDEGVASSLGIAGFGLQSFRISDAVTSGCFADQAYAKPLTDSVGETSSTAGAFSAGTKQKHFETQFDIASAVPDAVQAGLHLSVSPDRGDGSRMSYLRFEDQADGVHVFFDDVTDAGPIGTTATFNESDIATITRGKHTIKLTIDTIDGPANDVVNVYIDGSLVKTGTTWEDYYRYDTESASEQSPRIIKTVQFRVSSTANTGNNGKGFLIDNFSEVSGLVTVKIEKYIDGQHATTVNADSSTFPMLTTFSSSNIGNATDAPFTLSPAGWGGDPAYEASFANSNPGANYATHEVTGGSVVGASCSDGKPFALVGYTVGDSLAAASSATPTATIPDMKNIVSNKFVIVWNTKCPVAPTPPLPPPANACALATPPAGYTLRNGTSGNDTVSLAPNTMFVGKGGNDTVTAGNGFVIICTGNGNDIITVGNGDVSIDAGGGKNTIKVGAGNGDITTGSGNDSITLGTGNHTVSAGEGNNDVTITGGNNSVTTGSGNDSVTTGSGSDTISAGGGNNKVIAGSGSDTVTTGSGNDSIDGGPGSDTCSAGGGVNTVINCTP